MCEPWDIYREYIDAKFIREYTQDIIEGNNLHIDKDILYWIKIWKVQQLTVYDFDFNRLPIEYDYHQGGGFGSKNSLVTKAKNMYHEYGHNSDNIEDPLYELFQKIDEFEVNLPQLTDFVLPGGEISVAQCHVSRTICRRAERRILEFSEQYPVKPTTIKYINRLSDFLFVLSRKLAYDKNVMEEKWKKD